MFDSPVMGELMRACLVDSLNEAYHLVKVCAQTEFLPARSISTSFSPPYLSRAPFCVHSLSVPWFSLCLAFLLRFPMFSLTPPVFDARLPGGLFERGIPLGQGVLTKRFSPFLNLLHLSRELAVPPYSKPHPNFASTRFCLPSCCALSETCRYRVVFSLTPHFGC